MALCIANPRQGINREPRPEVARSSANGTTPESKGGPP